MFENIDNISIIISLISMGFFGGFTHCITMCGPFVITQVSNQLSSTHLEDYHGIKKLSKIALIPYHLGRITTYGIIGFSCSYLRSNIDNFIGFEIFSAILILIACLYFINLFIKNNNLKTKLFGLNFAKEFFLKNAYKSKFFSYFKNSLIIKKNLKFLNNFFGKIVKKKINFLLNNSSGFNGFILGLILGFLPCGMLYGAFSLAGSMSNYFLAFVGMISFGIATFFALFCVGFFAKLSFKLSEFKIIANIVIIINILMLFKMFFKKFSNF